MPVIIATVAPPAIAAVVFLVSNRLEGERRRDRRSAANACLALFAATTVFSSATLAFACYSSNTPLTDDAINVYRMVATGRRESTDVPTEKLEGSIIIYFKPGCPDCAAIWDELTKAVDEASAKNPRGKTYFVNTKSPTGRALLERYPVDEIPSGVYVASKGNNTPAFREVLFEKTRDYETEDVETTFRKDSLEFLFECQNQNW